MFKAPYHLEMRRRMMRCDFFTWFNICLQLVVICGVDGKTESIVLLISLFIRENIHESRENIQYSKDFSIQGRDYFKSTFRINHPFMTQGTETFTSVHIFMWLYRMWWWIFRIRMKDTTDICLKIATLRKCNVTDVTLVGL